MKSSLVLVLSFGLAIMCRADAVRLHINGPDGQPVVGAQVRVMELKSSSGDDMFGKPVDLQSDATGDVSLESKNSLSKSLSPQKRNYLLARVLAPGMAVKMADLRAGDNTLSLEKGESYGGIVLDAEEKPVAGAKVALTQLASNKRDLQISFLFGEQKLQVQTDAQGKWNLDNVPTKGALGFTVTAPHFKIESLTLDVARPAPPIYLDKGATIKGRVLKPDGTPAGGVRFYAGNSVDLPVTNADGTFEADADVDDGVYLQVLGGDSSKIPFVVPMKRVDDLQPGEIRDIGDWKGIEGIHLRGTVVDAVSKKPIEDASVSSWGNSSNAYGQTDEKGHFDILVSADATSFMVSGVGHISLDRKSIPTARDGVADAGTIPLNSGAKVRGTLKTAGGEGTATFLMAQKTDGNMVSTWVDEEGNFELGGLTPGEYTLSSSDFDLVGKPKLTVGTGELAPLQLEVEGGKEALVPPTVTGRVLFEQHPVVGAKVRIQFSGKNGASMTQTVLSSTDGVFTLTSSTPNRIPKIFSVSRPGYGTGSGELKNEGGVWRGDVVLQKQGLVLRGRVVDAAGRPVANAFVGGDKGREMPVSTDANGEFALPEAPTPGVILLASDGPRLQSFKFEKEGTPVQIVLPDAPPVVADKIALAEQIVPGARADWEWAKQWTLPGDEDLGGILVGIRSNPVSDRAWSSVVQTLAATQPTQFLAHEDEIRARMRDANKGDFERLEMLAKAASTDTATRAQVKAWLDDKEQEKRDISPNSVRALLELAEVAQKLDPKVGAMWLDYAAQLNAQLPQSKGDASTSWGQLAARVSPQAVETLSEEWTPGAKLQLLSSAMQTYRKRADSTNARLTFAQMEKQTAQAQNKGETIILYGDTRPPKEILAQGRDQLARTLAVTEPKAALEVTRQLDDYQKGNVFLMVARTAVKQGDLDTARAALNSLIEIQTANPDFVAQAAGLAQRFDAPLANAIYTKAFRLVLSKNREFTDWSPTIADYVKARASQSAGASRILLEREWVQRKEMADKQKPDDYSNSRQMMKDLAVAMATVSPQRALEMVEQLSTQDGLRAQARGEIAVELLREQ